MKKFVVFAIIISFITVFATDQFDWTPVKVRTPKDGLLLWALAEAYRDHHPDFGREKVLDQSRFKNPQVLACFPDDIYKGDTADASVFVLLYAPNWNTSKKTPILLVHGAADDAFRAWAHPMAFSTPSEVPEIKQGFMQKFAKAGYPVFAINFSHNHGCNYRQAEQIHNAIQVIKKKTGATKVHLLAHSKGNCSASIYTCGGISVNPNQRFLSAFQQDVDTYIQVAPGNKGVDTMFRYYSSNLTVISLKAPAPISFQEALIYGMWQKYYKEDIYKNNPGTNEIGNYFPGQSQLLYNLVEDGLGFTPFCYTPFDANLTMKACYYGGTTLFVSSYGIQHAIEEGENTIERINKQGLDPSVKLLNLYGTNPAFIEIDMIYYKIPVSVPDHPSDGAVYVHSAKYVDGLLSRGAYLLGQKGFDKNHVILSCSRDCVEWIVSNLNE